MLSHALPVCASPKPSPHWQLPAPFLAALAGHGLSLPSTHAVASVVLENSITPHTSHDPAAVADCPVTPLPETHCVWSWQYVGSSLALYLDALHATHEMSAELDPLPGARPSPTGQFCHNWHVAPPVENCCVGHSPQTFVDVPVSPVKPPEHVHTRSTSDVHAETSSAPAPHAVHAAHSAIPAMAATLTPASHAEHAEPSPTNPTEQRHSVSTVVWHALWTSEPLPHEEQVWHVAPAELEYVTPSSHPAHTLLPPAPFASSP